mmetsp:Transcript_37693/g.43052  ORF Transcript_37693/g.43052 Transcript_37693/m.43052 type:complete len:153 (+) Transcript_37693:64-522(+)
MLKLHSIFAAFAFTLLIQNVVSESFCETKSNGEDNCIDVKAATPCEDNHKNCAGWAKNGECDKNPKYMGEHCLKSCDSCPKSEYKERIYAIFDQKRLKGGPCEDNHEEDCPRWESEDKCSTNAIFMLGECRRSCSMCYGQTHSRPSIMPPSN